MGSKLVFLKMCGERVKDGEGRGEKGKNGVKMGKKGEA